MSRPKIAIIGASNDRNKFGNKAVRAYLKQGYEVFPVNIREEMIEGLKAYKSVLDIPDELDRVSIYLPPQIGINVLQEVAKKGLKEVWLNPGADTDAVINKAYELGLKPIVACSILGVGLDPNKL